MRVWIDPDKCQGHTLCSMVAPKLFQLRDDDGRAYVTMDQIPPELADLARKAELGCPERAVVVYED